MLHLIHGVGGHILKFSALAFLGACVAAQDRLSACIQGIPGDTLPAESTSTLSHANSREFDDDISRTAPRHPCRLDIHQSFGFSFHPAAPLPLLSASARAGGFAAGSQYIFAIST